MGEIIHGTEENSAVSHNRFTEVFHKYMSIDTFSWEGEVLRFTCQSASDIQCKLQKTPDGPTDTYGLIAVHGLFCA